MEREDKKSIDVLIEPKHNNSKSRNDKQSLRVTFNSSTIKFEPKVDNEQCVIPKSKTVIFIPKLNMNKINLNADNKPHVISYDKYKYIFEDVEPNITSSTKRNGSRSKRLRELKQRSNQSLSLFDHNKHK